MDKIAPGAHSGAAPPIARAASECRSARRNAAARGATMKQQTLEMPYGSSGAPAPRQSRFSVKLYYGLGAIAYGVKDNGFSFFLLLYYNQVLGLPAAWVGAAIMIALIVDAISDPMVGYASDNLHSRWGRRHPLMYASALPVGLTYFLLWNPPAELAGRALFAYLVAFAILVRTTITFYEIPSSSLVAELTDQYDERTSMLSYRFFFGWWGGLTMAIAAYFVFLRPTAKYPVGQLNLVGWHHYGTAAAIIMLVAILLSTAGLHPQIPHLKLPPPKRPFDARRVARELKETLSNRSFLMLFVSAIFGAAAAGVSTSLNIYFGTFFWELTPTQLGILALGPLISSAVALLAAPRISLRMGKKRGVMWIFGVATVAGPLPIIGRLVGLMPANGSPALMPVLFIFTVIEVALIVIGSILLASMVADVVEDSQLQTGRRSEGVFFAARSFIAKSVQGIGVLAATMLLAAIGFPQNAKPGQVDPHVIFNLGLVYVPVLLTLYLISLAFISGYRISRETHEQNLRKLSDV
jgi:glycoside/pentoside/hexuronide:cation symporter, GPH family